ncbi:FAD-dependent monooxygenase [Kitasatospora cineracea]|uniref:2-polyprenyl-6-methoxyphenol hydroxylase-like FAD-dependent oxidoreductase n=1 Tax=Kitasatospora cineracea TaxID=88074 RepID=A0A3N4RJH7_9ACTN|nr:FAD-dependent monooxygenase [Kitasatospora cineracea]ROR43172.1 2-polyprenyl-6-methoxyphenol hydroxylase-like FAD-dependent oxidoreductase [Kitasatospora cineracea]RPE33542.1 2-polyprenyl-6-methoxyphenol hydroxylase-like FAD-dependent oxidoreductase [Kitasatospora cineracea]
MSETEFTADVLVVGAGPTGLLLAGDLAAAGLRVAVLEKRAEESGLTRAFAVHARTLELLDARGLADELIATGRAMPSLQVFGRLRVDLAGLPTRFPFVLVTPQYNTERVLRERAVKAGAELLRDAEVTGLRQDGRGVVLTARTADGERSFRSRYAVGADGVRSSVRDLLGIPFPGEAAVRSVMLADVRLEREPDEPLTAGAGEAGFAFLAPFGDGWYRVIGWSREHQVPDTEPVALPELADLLREVTGRDHGVLEARWTSRFHSDERQAPSYRSGRVFLAGDAAHCHSPAGGQGMNTGLQDAANLSWKLVAAVRGWAPDALLDTYQTERHPVGRAVLRSSGALVRLAQGRHAPTRALRSALGAAAGHLGPLAELGAKQVSGIGHAYPAEKGAHPLVGRRVPDLRLAVDAPGGPARLHEALRSGKAVLVSNDELSVADSWADRVVTAAPADPHGKLRDTVLLVRPDGYAAWACADPTRGELRAALSQWLGRP